MIEFVIDSKQTLEEFNACLIDGSVSIIENRGNSLLINYGDDKAEVKVMPEYITSIEYNTTEIDKLIYGKNSCSHIVNISYKNNQMHIFREVNGEVKHFSIPYKHWVLGSSAGNGTVRLKGDTHYKYLKEFDTENDFIEQKQSIWKYRLYNIANFPEAFMTRHGFTYFKGMKPTEVSSLSFDIETSGLDPLAKNAKVFLITNHFRKANGDITNKTFNIDNYKNDKEMITDWCRWVREINPSILLGHNILIFDLPYLETRAGELLLGRDNSALEFEDRIRQKRKDGSQSYSYKRVTVFGREVIDTFFLMLTADALRKFESYALKVLIKAIGQEKVGRTYIDAGKIAEFWSIPEKKKDIIQYAEEDAEDSLKLFDKFASPYFYFTQHIPKSFQMMMETATGGQLNSFLVRSYLQLNESIPLADDVSEEKVEGGISFGIPGIYNNLFKIDIKSAYPSQILRLKLYNKAKDPKANFYNMVHYFANKRFEYKKLAKETGDPYWIDLDAVGKICINSSYGVTNTSGLNFNDAHIAQVITKETREVIDLSLRWASGNGYKYWIDKFYAKMETKEDKIKYLSLDGYHVASIQHDFIVGPSDTDSISFCKADMSKFSDEEIKTLTKEINDLSPDMIEWENDGYYDSCLALKAKNYVLKIGDKYIKKGSALKSSKLEPALKALLDDLIRDSLENNGNNLKEIYHSYLREAMNVTDIMRWCQKKTVTKPVLDCARNPEARKNERDIWDAISNKAFQEGDKIYLYPCVISSEREETHLKNGKIRVKETKVTGLRCAEDYNGDVNVEKLIERVYDTVSILDNILDENPFINYTLSKNKHLLDNL